jgi:hypothetical protein
MKKRDLHKCLCDVCGSSYEVFYCGTIGDYICSECLEREEEEEEEEIKPRNKADYDEKIGEY